MPYIQTRLSIKLDESQKLDLQSKIANIVSEVFSKPVNYIMAEIVDDCSLYMGGKILENGAYISIGLLGSTTKEKCNIVTNKVCSILSSECGTSGSGIYITFHPTDLWGWNGMMF